ncbi:MAG: S41 family peptidase [Bacteroidaceae bacterium]|nr:S41 family peptidase [Bacteroidaceae bacterium]
MRKLSAMLFAAAITTAASAETVRFASRPSLSPDGKTIYFEYDGDIFQVPSEGGLALRLISLGGFEGNPVVSPDGKMLAFSSDIMGNNDVYVVPTAGGEAVQLTFADARDYPVSWSADSKYIYMESQRSSSSRTTYRVPASGGTPQLMFPGYFNTIVNLKENPKTGEFYFNESGEAISFPTRKHYVGDHNPNIKSWNPRKKEYTELTDYEGKDSWPMVDRDGNLYYVTDQFGGESNIAAYVKGGAPRQLTSFDKSVQYPSISFDGSRIVFLKDYQMHLLDPKSGKVTVPEITVAASGAEVKRSFTNQRPTNAAVSPDGKKFALVIRGLLFVTDAKGKYVQQLETPANERVVEVLWGKDNTTIYYTRTHQGPVGLYKIGADGKTPETEVYCPDHDVREIVMSHGNDRIAFLDGNNSIMLYFTEQGLTQNIANAEFWSFYGTDIRFSSDDKLVAFVAKNRFEDDIYIYSMSDGTLTNMTNSASEENGMVFSPDGKYMYLLANFENTSFPRGSSDYLYKLPLRKYDTPFKSDVYDKLFEEEKKDKDKEKNKEKKDSTVVIDYSEIFRRMERVDRVGSQFSTYVFQNKDKSYLIYGGTGDDGSRVYKSLDLSDSEAKPKVIKDLRSGMFFASKTELFALDGNVIKKVDAAGGSASNIEFSKNIEKLITDEFEQMFYEVWSTLKQNYYDPELHGADWEGIREYYSSLLQYVHTRQQLRTLITDMLGELNSSHLGFSTNGAEEGSLTDVYTMATGIVFSEEDGKAYVVDRVLRESPADKIEIDLKKGDRLVAVDGVRVDPKKNREMYFSSPVKKDELSLTFERGGKEFTVKTHTTTAPAFKTLQYLEWEDQRKAMVKEKTGDRVAYIHMRAMGDDDLQNFLLNMYTDASNKDALILDLRYNNGGNVHNEVIEFLSQKEYFTWSHRDFDRSSHPNVTPACKPIVVLVNEHSLSDAEVTSNGIQTLGLAKLVGTETYRWIIFTSSVRLIDNSTCRMPAWGCYNEKGQDLENVGVKPDIYVRNTFKDRLENKDPQLDAAIKEVMGQLAEMEK